LCFRPDSEVFLADVQWVTILMVHIQAVSFGDFPEFFHKSAGFLPGVVSSALFRRLVVVLVLCLEVPCHLLPLFGHVRADKSRGPTYKTPNCNGNFT